MIESVVPQHPVIARRDQERHGDVHIVLGELHVLAVIVHLPVLVLAEAVEALVGAAVELLADGEEGLTLLGHRAKEGVPLSASTTRPAASRKRTNPVARSTSAEHMRGREGDVPRRLADREAVVERLRRHHLDPARGQNDPDRPCPFDDADDAVAIDEELHLPIGQCARSDADAVVEAAPIAFRQSRSARAEKEQGRRQAEQAEESSSTYG